VKCVLPFIYHLKYTLKKKKERPVLLWLSGLSCTEQNFITKSAFQESATEYGFIVVAPDTSPRNLNIPGEDDSYDFGSGAGFYLDAIQDPWKKNYRMYSYITKELFELINSNFPTLPNKWGIFGHSMGGHGALTCFFKNPDKFKSVSAFAPICNPINCPWGQKAFSGYLGDDNKDAWKEYDACELVKKYNGHDVEILIDQGDADDFYKQAQLLPKNLIEAANSNDKVVIDMKMREGYDHSYFYITSFIDDHFEHHNKWLVEFKEAVEKLSK